MNLGDNRGIKTSKWFPNEMLRNDDINYIGRTTYHNYVDDLSTRFNRTWASSGNAIVVGGLEVVHDNLLTVTLQVGSAISSEGTYLAADSWGFSPAVDSFYAVVVGQDTQIGFVVGGTYSRYDTIEVRPVENPYGATARNFKDPITGIISTAVVDTRVEYGWEFVVRKGDDTAPGSVPPSRTPGWIKIAEVAIGASATSITDAEITTFVNSTDWLTDTGVTILSPLKLGPLEVRGDANFTGALQKDGSDVVTTDSGTQTITGDKNFTGALQKDGSDVVTSDNAVINSSTQLRIPTAEPASLEDGDIWVAS